MDYILIIIIIIIIILSIIYLEINQISYDNTSFYNYWDIKDKLKTGDIILFSCRSHENFINKFMYYCRTKLIGSEYGHVGLIFRDNNKLYLVECVGENHLGDQYSYHINNYGKGGVRIVDLETLLKEYSKAHAGYFAVKFISNGIPNYLFMDKIWEHRDKIFEDKKYLVLLAIIDIYISHQLASNIAQKFSKKNRLMCSEFVHTMLYQCNALKKYPSKIFWPSLFTNEIFEKIQNIRYSAPYKFVIDNNDTNNHNNHN